MTTDADQKVGQHVAWLGDSVRGSFLTEVWHRALKAPRKEAPYRGYFDAYMRRVLKTRGLDVGGARTPERIPRGKFSQRYFAREFEEGSRIAQATALLWASAQAPLLETATEVLSAAGFEVGARERLLPKLPAAAEGQMDALCEQIALRLPEEKPEAVRLMVKVLLGSPAPEPDESEQAEEAATEGALCERFQRWIHELEELASGAGEWASLPRFQEALTELAQRKASEGENASRQEGLRALAADLDDRESVSSLCNWFERSPEAVFPLVEALPPDTFEAAKKQLERLLELQAEVVELNEIPPSDRREWTLRIERIAKLEGEYHERWEALASLATLDSQAAEQSLTRPRLLIADAQPTPESADVARTNSKETDPGRSPTRAPKAAPPTSVTAADRDLEPASAPGDEVEVVPGPPSPTRAAEEPTSEVPAPVESGASPAGSLEAEVERDTKLSGEEREVPAPEPQGSEANQEVVYDQDALAAAERDASGAKLAVEDAGAKLVVGQPPLTPSSETVAPTRTQIGPRNQEPSTPSARDVPAAAVSVDTPPSEAARPDLLPQLLGSGDLRGAYWWVRAEEAAERSQEVPSWLIAATQGAMLVEGPTSGACAGVLAYANDNTVPENPASARLANAAALVGSLRAPSMGLMNWLGQGPAPSAIRPILDAVLAFVTYGMPLPKQLSTDLDSREKRSERLERAAADTRQWLDDSRKKIPMYHGTVEVWRELAKTSIFELLEPVIQNDTKQLETVQKLLKHFGEADLRGMISEVDQRVRHGRPPLVGSPVRWLLDRCEEARTHAATWAEIATLQKSQDESPGWMDKQVGLVRAAVLQHLQPAVSELVGERLTAPPLQAATAAVLLGALAELGDMVGVPVPEEARAVQPQQVIGVLDGTRSLRSILAQRLVSLPSVTLPASANEPWDAALPQITEALLAEAEEPQDVESLIQSWCSKKDFRFVSQLIELLPKERRESVAVRFETSRTEAREALAKELLQTEAALESAHLENVLTHELRSQLKEALSGIDPATTEDVGSRLGRVAAVRASLKKARSEGLDRHRRSWAALRRDLSAILSEEQRSLVIERVEAAFANSDVRSVDELLAHLHDVVGGAGQLRPALFKMPKPNTVLEDFLSWLPQAEKKIGTNRNRREIAALLNGMVPENLQRPGLKKGLDEVAAIWSALPANHSQGSDPRRGVEALGKVLELLSLQLRDGVRNSLTEGKPIGDARVWSVSVSSAQNAPVPQFGSRAEGRWRVVVVGSRPLDLDKLVRQIKGRNEATLVLYAGRLSLTQRTRLRHDLGRKVDAIVVDEWLALYLAQHPLEARNEVLFRCTLPWSHVNPYQKQGGGSVPPEMFYGREDIVSSLERLDGTRIIFGGRQLGKSAVLRRVERDFHDPAQHRFAAFVDIKEIGDRSTGHKPLRIWGAIRDTLKQIDLLPKQVTTDDSRQLIRHILERLQGPQPRQLLILLDEADAFLDADAAHNLEQVKLLRELMDGSHGRCKVVLAGLHNVQRFQGIPNQPLVQFGTAQLIGPLEPREAIRLVEEPLSMLGYRFKPEELNASLLHILGYTNYHPLLVQIFCAELVDALQKRDAQRGPPYVISDSDVHGLYRRQEIQAAIRNCFEWTLNLDERYLAIALSLAVEQLGQGGEYDRNYSVQDLLDQARGWWPAAFDDLRSDGMRGLLDEMVGLGILVVSGGKDYRLRSPNVIRLLGTAEDLQNRLAELASKPAPQAFRADNYHPPLLSEGCYSPWTHAQERQLMEASTGVQLVSGSDATGLTRIPEALGKIVEDEGRRSEHRFREVSADCNSVAQLERLIHQERKAHPKLKQLTLLHAPAAGLVKQGTYVDEADALCHRMEAEKRLQVRCVFVLDPLASWLWHEVAVPAKRERGHYRMLELTRWSPLGAMRLLEVAELQASDEDARQIIQRATGGWHFLMEAFRRNAKPGSAKQAMEAFLRERSGSPAAAEELRRYLGIDALPGALELLRTLRKHESDDIFGDLGEIAVLVEDSRLNEQQLTRMARHLVRLGCIAPDVNGRPRLAPLMAEALA